MKGRSDHILGNQGSEKGGNGLTGTKYHVACLAITCGGRAEEVREVALRLNCGQIMDVIL